jgi:hypothetical protein
VTTEVITQPQTGNGLKRAAKRLRRKPASTSQSGAALFPHLVWAHYRWERRLHVEGVADAELEAAYKKTLQEFQSEQGALEQVYWSTKTPSAVGMTVIRGRPPRANLLRLRERDDEVHFHRVTDWVTRDAPLVADLLYECDLLASRVEHVLRGASERIATRWILGIASHLLGYLERDVAEKDRVARLAVVAVLCVLAAWLLSRTDTSAHHRKIILLCCGAGAVGALVSTVSRMGSPDSGKFNVDFELGRPMIRRLGLFRPFVGAIFGAALAFLLISGLLDLKPTSGLEPYYYGFAAFLAGFSERFAKVMLGGAEERLVPHDKTAAQPPADATDAEEI